MKTNPFKAVSFNEKAIRKALAAAGSIIVETKYDGVRGNVLVQPGGLTFLSRVGKTIPALSWLDGVALPAHQILTDDRQPFREGFMIDCEFLVKGVDFNTGSGLLRTAHSDTKNYRFNCNPDAEETTKKSRKVPFQLDPERVEARVIAVIPIDDVATGKEYPVDSALMQYHVANAVAILRDKYPAIDWKMTHSQDVFDFDELAPLFKKAREDGQEGLIIKDPLCNYKRGKKSGWWKMKPEGEADGEIVGLVWGTEGLANEGKVIGFEVLLESGRVVNATNISQALMDEFTHNVKTFDTDYYLGYACQVNYMEETPDGSLRHPSFEKFRGTESDPFTKM